MNIFNNWLFQAVIANLICFLLGNVFISIYKTFKKIDTANIKNSYKISTLRKQFYFSLILLIVSVILLFIFKKQTILVTACVLGFWCIVFIISAFECSVEQITPKSKSKRNKTNSNKIS